MKKLISLFLFLTLLSACQKSDILGEVLPAGETIAFVPEVQTKATPITNATIDNFGVFCYYSDTQRWAEAEATTKPNKLCNVVVTKTDGKWSYNPPVKWTKPGTDTLANAVGSFFHFFGYAPHATKASTIAVNTTATSVGAPTLTFTQPLDVASQTDLLAARPKTNWQWGIGVTVPMQFEHMLARIAFAANVLEPEPNMTYTITEISLKYATFGGYIFRKGNLNLATWLWSDLAEPVDNDYQMLVPLSGDANLSTTLKTVSSADNQLLFIPQDVQSGSIVATFTVSKTGGGSKTLTTPLPATTWEQGKHYTYTYSVSYESSNIALQEVQVVNWTTSSGGSMDIN